MRIINGKLYDYKNNIEADIHYDCFKKEVSNDQGEIFRENDIVEIDGKTGFIFKIYDKDYIVVKINKNYGINTPIDFIKHSNKKIKIYDVESILDEPRSLKSIVECVKTDRDSTI